MPYRRIENIEGSTVDVWEEPDATHQGYESRSSLNANGWLIFASGNDDTRGLRLYPRDWCDLPEQRLRELYRRARPRSA
jgi:hypothetical protein